MAQNDRLEARPSSSNFGFKLEIRNLSWMAKGVGQSVILLLLFFLTFVNSFVLPNQHMQLEVYDSAPLVQFPARHSGSLQVEDWVFPAPVSDLIPVVDLVGDGEDIGEPIKVQDDEDSSSYILPVSPEKKKRKKSKKKKDSEAGNHAKTKKQQFKDVLSKVKTKSKKSGKSKSKEKSKKSKSGKSKKSKKSRAKGKKKKKTKRVEH